MEGADTHIVEAKLDGKTNKEMANRLHSRDGNEKMGDVATSM